MKNADVVIIGVEDSLGSLENMVLTVLALSQSSLFVSYNLKKDDYVAGHAKMA